MEMKQMAERLNNVSVKRKGKRLLAAVLAVLMVIPATGYGVFAHAQETKTITAFADLAGEAKTITLPTGTLEKELPLPETVTATVERTVYEETTTDSNATENGSQDGSAVGTEPVEKIVTEDVALAVTWESDKPFSSETADTFTYTAKVTEEGYTLAAGISLPQIQVKIEDGGKLAFSQSTTIDGIEITVNAEKGVFPQGAVLYAQKVRNAEDKEKIEDAVSNVFLSHGAKAVTGYTDTVLISYAADVLELTAEKLSPAKDQPDGDELTIGELESGVLKKLGLNAFQDPFYNTKTKTEDKRK